MPLNLPILITWLRILMIPLLVGVFYMPHEWIADHDKNLVATLIFSFAAITDWLDGYLARTLDQTSRFGAFLDPVADKLMVATALIVLVRALQSPRLYVRRSSGGSRDCCIHQFLNRYQKQPHHH